MRGGEKLTIDETKDSTVEDGRKQPLTSDERKKSSGGGSVEHRQHAREIPHENMAVSFR